MKKTFVTVTALLTAGMMMSHARAQQTPAANPSPAAPATTAPAPKASASSAAKTGKAPAAATKAPAAKSQSALKLDSPKAKASYAIGLNIGKGMKQNSVDVDPDVVLQGLKDGLTGSKALLSDDEVKSVLTALQTHLH